MSRHLIRWVLIVVVGVVVLGVGVQQLLTAQSGVERSGLIDPQAVMLSETQLTEISMQYALPMSGLVGEPVSEDFVFLSLGQWFTQTQAEMNLEGTGFTRQSPVFVHQIKGTFQRPNDPASEIYNRIVIAIEATTGQVLQIRSYERGYLDGISLDINVSDISRTDPWPTLVPVDDTPDEDE